MSIKLRRSALYVPAINARALVKAQSLQTDAVIIDLEDSVSPSEKQEARKCALEAVAARKFGASEVVVRVNALTSLWGRDDLEAIAAVCPDAVLVPKIYCAQDLISVAQMIPNADRIQIWAMLETPAAMLRTLEIAEVRRGPVPQLTALVMGTNDLSKDTRAVLSPGRHAYLPWLMQGVAAARAAGLDILDGVFNDFSDLAGFREECWQGRDLGMDGKTLIHPGQVEGANEIFAPSEEEIAWAKRIREIFDQPENARAGVIKIDGKMVERLHAEMARRVLELASAAGL